MKKHSIENLPNIKLNVDLSKHSTMRIGGKAKYFIEIESEEELKEVISALEGESIRILVIGDGSNTIFTGDFNGLIIKNRIKGIEKVNENDEFVTIKAMGGENWHSFVEFCVNENLAGNENLAYIPGTVGAAPVQNIAAYGQVQEDTFFELEAYNLKTCVKEVFDAPECNFAYRSSVFKTKYKDEYIITSVTYKLRKAEEYIPDTTYHSRYESLGSVLEQIAEKPYTLKDVFRAVIQIRRQKLPLVEEVGTVGSFFVNPFVSIDKLEKLKKDFPNIQYYPVDKMQYPGLDDETLKKNEIVKIPAGWIIEELGWRGKSEGNIGTSPKHALCLVVNGPATGSELMKFAEKIKIDVKQKTGIDLQTEVNIIE